jgi:hypothetical protein
MESLNQQPTDAVQSALRVLRHFVGKLYAVALTGSESSIPARVLAYQIAPALGTLLAQLEVEQPSAELIPVADLVIECANAWHLNIRYIQAGQTTEVVTHLDLVRAVLLDLKTLASANAIAPSAFETIIRKLDKSVAVCRRVPRPVSTEAEATEVTPRRDQAPSDCQESVSIVRLRDN